MAPLDSAITFVYTDNLVRTAEWHGGCSVFCHLARVTRVINLRFEVVRLHIPG